MPAPAATTHRALRWTPASVADRDRVAVDRDRADLARRAGGNRGDRRARRSPPGLAIAPASGSNSTIPAGRSAIGNRSRASSPSSTSGRHTRGAQRLQLDSAARPPAAHPRHRAAGAQTARPTASTSRAPAPRARSARARGAGGETAACDRPTGHRRGPRARSRRRRDRDRRGRPRRPDRPRRLRSRTRHSTSRSSGECTSRRRAAAGTVKIALVAIGKPLVRALTWIDHRVTEVGESCCVGRAQRATRSTVAGAARSDSESGQTRPGDDRRPGAPPEGDREPEAPLRGAAR